MQTAIAFILAFAVVSTNSLVLASDRNKDKEKEKAKAKAMALLRLQQLQRDRGEAETLRVMPRVSEGTYSDLHQQAIDQGRPLLIWVGVQTSPLVARFSDCYHYFCEEFQNRTGPMVIVAVPSNGALWWVGETNSPSERAIKTLIDKKN